MVTKLKNFCESKYFFYTLCVLLIMIGLPMCITANLTYDESYSYAMAKLSIEEIISITAHDVHPPAYYIALHLFVNIFPVVIPQLTKIFSGIFYLAYFALVWKTSDKYLPGIHKNFLLFLSVFFPCMVVQGYNVRMYSFALFWSYATVICLLRFFKEEISKAGCLLLIVCSLMAMYTHTYTLIGVFIMYVMLFIGLICRKAFKKVLYILLCGGIVAVGFWPWLSVLLKQTADRGGEPSAFTMDAFWVIVSEWCSSWHTPSMTANKLGVALFIVLTLVAIWGCWKSKTVFPFVAAIPFVLVTVVGILMCVYYAPSYFGRHSYCFIWGIFILMSAGYKVLPRVGKLAAIVVVLAMFGKTCYNEIQLETEDGLRLWEEFAEANIKEEDLIMLSSIHCATLDTENDRMMFGPVPEFSPYSNVESFLQTEQWEPYAEHNIWWICNSMYTPTYYGYQGEKRLEFVYQNIEFSVWSLNTDFVAR